jgi:hypothetical protein
MTMNPTRAAVRMIAVGLALLFASTVLYVAAFHAPHARGLDLAVVGGRAAAARLQAQLDARRRGDFDVRAFADDADARAALLDTDVHGVVMPQRVLVAQALGAAQTETVVGALRDVLPRSEVHDLRPLPPGDRRGLSSLFTVIGTVIPSLVFGVILWVFGRPFGARVRWGAVLAYALLAGPLVALDAEVVVGAFDGGFVGLAVACGLLALAVAAAAHGLAHLGGPAGIAIAAFTLVLVGLSSSGGAVGYQFEPGFYGALSQWLPPGAAVTAVRNVVYFDWSATSGPLVVLGAWALGGLALGLLAERRAVNGPVSFTDRRASVPGGLAR